jgi:hypothetical protein
LKLHWGRRELIAKKYIPGIAAFTMMWPVLSAADEGRPVTAADLSGKTVCWTGDLKVTYTLTERGSSNRRGRLSHSIWSVPEPGVVKFRIRYVPMTVLPDGRFQTHQLNARNVFTPSRYNDEWGTVCN